MHNQTTEINFDRDSCEQTPLLNIQQQQNSCDNNEESQLHL